MDNGLYTVLSLSLAFAYNEVWRCLGFRDGHACIFHSHAPSRCLFDDGMQAERSPPLSGVRISAYHRLITSFTTHRFPIFCLSAGFDPNIPSVCFPVSLGWWNGRITPTCRTMDLDLDLDLHLTSSSTSHAVVNSSIADSILIPS